MTRLEVEEAAARGAALLDGVTPGWFKRIDLEKLNVASARDCVLGQTADGFIGDHPVFRYLDTQDGLQIERHGFDFCVSWAFGDKIEESGECLLRILNLAWSREIGARLAGREMR